MLSWRDWEKLREACCLGETEGNYGKHVVMERLRETKGSMLSWRDWGKLREACCLGETGGN